MSLAWVQLGLCCWRMDLEHKLGRVKIIDCIYLPGSFHTLYWPKQIIILSVIPTTIPGMFSNPFPGFGRETCDHRVRGEFLPGTDHVAHRENPVLPGWPSPSPVALPTGEISVQSLHRTIVVIASFCSLRRARAQQLSSTARPDETPYMYLASVFEVLCIGHCTGTFYISLCFMVAMFCDVSTNILPSFCSQLLCTTCL